MADESRLVIRIEGDSGPGGSGDGGASPNTPPPPTPPTGSTTPTPPSTPAPAPPDPLEPTPGEPWWERGGDSRWTVNGVPKKRGGGRRRRRRPSRGADESLDDGDGGDGGGGVPDDAGPSSPPVPASRERMPNRDTANRSRSSGGASSGFGPSAASLIFPGIAAASIPSPMGDEPFGPALRGLEMGLQSTIINVFGEWERRIGRIGDLQEKMDRTHAEHVREMTFAFGGARGRMTPRTEQYDPLRNPGREPSVGSGGVEWGETAGRPVDGYAGGRGGFPAGVGGRSGGGAAGGVGDRDYSGGDRQFGGRSRPIQLSDLDLGSGEGGGRGGGRGGGFAAAETGFFAGSRAAGAAAHGRVAGAAGELAGLIAGAGAVTGSLLAAGAAAGAFAGTITAATSFVDGQLRRYRGLAPQTAVASAEVNVQRMVGDFRRAGELDEGLARFTRARGNLGESISDMQADLTKALIDAGLPQLLEIASELVDMLAPVVSFFGGSTIAAIRWFFEFWKSIGEKFAWYVGASIEDLEEKKARMMEEASRRMRGMSQDLMDAMLGMNLPVMEGFELPEDNPIQPKAGEDAAPRRFQAHVKPGDGGWFDWAFPEVEWR